MAKEFLKRSLKEATVRLGGALGVVGGLATFVELLPVTFEMLLLAWCSVWACKTFERWLLGTTDSKGKEGYPTRRIEG